MVNDDETNSADDSAEARHALSEERRKVSKLTGEELKKEQEQLDLSREVLATDEARVIALKELFKQRQKDANLAETSAANAQKDFKAEKLNLDARLDKQLDYVDALMKESAAQAALGKRSQEDHENFVRRQNKRKKGLRDSKAAADELGKSLGQAFRTDKAVNFSAGLNKVAKGMASMGSYTNIASAASKGFTGILDSLIDNMVGVAIAVIDAENSFKKVTGASDKFARGLTETWEVTRQYGATIEDVTAAHTDLFKTYTDFTMMNEQVRKDLAKTVTILSKFGISTQDSAKSVQLMTKAMGVVPEQADEALLRLRDLAVNIGVAPAEMNAQFAAASGQLAKFGASGEKAFKGVALQAKLTGLEIPKILALVEKFDTFEGAAEQAGMLNAALGGNFVNAMDLLMEEDPAARFDMIRDAIRHTGLSFTDMSYQQRLFYTEALKLSDVGELALVMSGNQDLLNNSMQQSQQDYIAAAEKAREYQTVQEQLKAAMITLVPVILPLVETLKDLLDWIGKNTERVGSIIKSLWYFVVVLKVVSIGLSIVTGLVAAGASPALALAAAFAAVVWVLVRLHRIMTKKRESPTFLETLTMLPEKFGAIGKWVSDATKRMFGFGDATAYANKKLNEKHSPSFMESLGIMMKAGIVTGATRSGEIGGAGAVAGAVGGSIVGPAGTMVGGVSAGTVGAVAGGVTGIVEGIFDSMQVMREEKMREEARAKTYVGRAPEGFVASASAPGYGATPGVAAPARFIPPEVIPMRAGTTALAAAEDAPIGRTELALELEKSTQRTAQRPMQVRLQLDGTATTDLLEGRVAIAMAQVGTAAMTGTG